MLCFVPPRSIHRECALLDGEASRLSLRLADSELDMENLRARTAAEHSDAANDLPGLRLSFRKRCRTGHSNALRLACALQTLETEQNGMAPQQKRTCALPSAAF